MVWGQEDGYHQDYDPDAPTKQEIYIFCRDCRKAFRVHVKARPRVKVRCTCGRGGRLCELDVFSDKEEAREFAVFYTRLVRDVKDVLRANDVPVPDSRRMEGGQALVAGAASEHPHALEIAAIQQKLASDVELVERHELLSELITLTFSCRRLVVGAREQCVEACRADLAISRELVRESKRRRKAGSAIRLSFSCFKHLSILLEEDGQLQGALEVAQQGKKLGLKGYDERIAALQAQLGS